MRTWSGSAREIMKTLAALIAAGLFAGLAAAALADSGPGTAVSFRVYPASVTVAGGPGIVVTRVWSDGVLTISAA
jgi:hypothetical protein